MTADLTEKIARALADVKSVDPEELDVSLENHVSTDAVRNLASHDSDSWRLQFETPDHVVEVTGTGRILVDGETVREAR
ncbi:MULTISPECIES: HalOD1 output domain-containing protein [Halorubrum]|uniref:Halobacterial output domain-containing protein n=1 Tax=Halorubrum sodomense TaxID=35743 RepID=A0A1I6H4X5_HALSD|nr:MULTISPECIES: HalOD1 output domain-containing protein [Halorubrum]SFR49478.1 hypothetical protein SAMN04487937_2450 [Halorubrum sodomense]